jgi:topoisomerase-4 subunit A
LPYEAPEEVPAEDIEVVGETVEGSTDDVRSSPISEEKPTTTSKDDDIDDKGQATLF